MHGEHSWFQKVRFGINIGTIYLLTLVVGWYIVHSGAGLATARDVSLTTQKAAAPPRPTFKVISGLPVRIVIPGSSYEGTVVDLPIDKGYYNQATDAWTLSGYHAQFMMISTLANNFAGDTYIYGHNNDYVFGALRHVTPAVGATALIYTDNGHIFSYHFVSAASVAPNVTSVLDYKGPPILTIQTCTGSFNEARTLYTFSFDKVLQ
jgi:hypothetical protein